MLPFNFEVDPRKIEDLRTTFAEEDIRSRSRAVVAVGYDTGVVFVVQNPYAQEGLFFTDPLSKDVAVLGAGSQGEYERLRMNFLNQRAGIEELAFGSEGGAREVNARKLVSNYLAPVMRSFFEGHVSNPVRVNWMLADTYWDKVPEIHTVDYKGLHFVRHGFASLGGSMGGPGSEDRKVRRNAIEEFLDPRGNRSLAWKPEMPLEDALHCALSAMRHAFETASEEEGGVTKEQREAYSAVAREAMMNGESIEISVIDKNLGGPGRDAWAPILPVRKASTYSRSPLTPEDAVQAIRNALS